MLKAVDDDDPRKAAIECVRRYTEEEIFGQDAYMTWHRSGLKKTYQEAARQEYSIVESIGIKTNEIRIAKCHEIEKLCRVLCEEIEATVSRLNEAAQIATEAKAKAKSVAQACDASNASHRQCILDAERYQALLHDLEPLNAPEISDADDVERILRQVSNKISLLKARLCAQQEQLVSGKNATKLADLEDYLAQVRAQRLGVLAACGDLCCEALQRFFLRGDNHDEALLEEVQKLFQLLRTAPPSDNAEEEEDEIQVEAAAEAAAQVQRQYCEMRSENKALPFALELCQKVKIQEEFQDENMLLECCKLISEQVCKPERTLHRKLFAVERLDDRDAGFVDSMLFDICETAIHESFGRPLVVKIAQLEQLRSLVILATSNQHDFDDAVSQALMNIVRDARERAIFVASTFVRDNIETNKEFDHQSPGLAPPVKAAIQVLSLLQGLAETPARNHFAQYALNAASAVIVKHHSSAEDLWLIAQLLALREALPQSKNQPPGASPTSSASVQRRSLNWTAARGALAEFNAKNQSTTNKRKHQTSSSRFAIIRKKLSSFVQNGLPRLMETTGGARRTIHNELATVTKRFIHNAHLGLVSPLIEFLVQLKAECPADLDDLRDASPAQLAALKGAPFAQSSHLNKILDASLTQAQHALPTLESKLSTYITNQNTRSLLLKSVKQRSTKTVHEFKIAASALLAPDLFNHLRDCIDKLHSIFLDD
uniref:Conserved oligomeric Golgi complex subunit 3 C-terminal domain-containing protein n=1 Tax=Aureoumbra lagunensis TaxID=44058 RepID=A0A7S3JYL1_9STRA